VPVKAFAETGPRAYKGTVTLTPNRRVALWLVDPANEFQQMLKADAEAACRKEDLAIEVYFTGDNLGSQVSQIRAALERPEPAKAFVVLATRDRGLGRCVHAAARVGTSWIYLNRAEDDLVAIRQEFPGVVIATVTADEVETGRIQGRQFRSLVKPGGLVLYVQGGTRSAVARDRSAGMLEAVAGAPFEVSLLEGGWDPSAARDAIRRWLTIVAPGNARIDLVGCQNDPIALAALEALHDAADALARPDLLRVPVTGCDGTPAVGQRLVNEGTLAATVVLPNWGGAAVRAAVRFMSHGERPAPMTLLKPTSFPAERDLLGVATAG
jgi:ABC-type sugar transport system substrate-binding protein